MSPEDKFKEIYLELNNLYEEFKNVDYLRLGTIGLAKIRREILRLLKEYLKLTISIQQGKVNENSLKNTNCYFYAINAPIPTNFKLVYERLMHRDFGYDVGELSGSRQAFEKPLTESTLLDRINGDLDFLEIKSYPSTLTSNNSHNGYKIATLINKENRDFHFLKQDERGLWHHKRGYKGNIEMLGNITSSDDILKNDLCQKYEYVTTLELVKPLKR